jgi:hypothetical protein
LILWLRGLLPKLKDDQLLGHGLQRAEFAGFPGQFTAIVRRQLR